MNEVSGEISLQKLNKRSAGLSVGGGGGVGGVVQFFACLTDCVNLKMDDKSYTQSYRLSPNELSQVVSSEKEKLRLKRIKQVREQSKDFAHNVRNRVENEKCNQIRIYKQQLKEKWRNEKENRISELEDELEKCCQHIGESQKCAKEIEDLLDEKQVQTQRSQTLAVHRGKDASKWLKEEIEMQNKNITIRKQTKLYCLEVEKQRAAKIAALPPRPKTHLSALENIPFDQSRSKSNVIRVKKADLQNEVNAIVAAEHKSIEDEKAQNVYEKLKSEQDQHALIRHQEALKKDASAKEYTQLISELQLLDQVDRLKMQKRILYHSNVQMLNTNRNLKNEIHTTSSSKMEIGEENLEKSVKLNSSDVLHCTESERETVDSLEKSCACKNDKKIFDKCYSSKFVQKTSVNSERMPSGDNTLLADLPIHKSNGKENDIPKKSQSGLKKSLYPNLESNEESSENLDLDINRTNDNAVHAAKSQKKNSKIYNHLCKSKEETKTESEKNILYWQYLQRGYLIKLLDDIRKQQDYWLWRKQTCLHHELKQSEPHLKQLYFPNLDASFHLSCDPEKIFCQSSSQAIKDSNLAHNFPTSVTNSNATIYPANAGNRIDLQCEENSIAAPQYVMEINEVKAKQQVIRNYQLKLLNRSELGRKMLGKEKSQLPTITEYETPSPPHSVVADNDEKQSNDQEKTNVSDSRQPINFTDINLNKKSHQLLPPGEEVDLDSSLPHMYVSNKSLTNPLPSPDTKLSENQKYFPSVSAVDSDPSPCIKKDSNNETPSNSSPSLTVSSSASTERANLFKLLKENKGLSLTIFQQTAEKLEKKGILKKSFEVTNTPNNISPTVNDKVPYNRAISFPQRTSLTCVEDVEVGSNDKPIEIPSNIATEQPGNHENCIAFNTDVGHMQKTFDKITMEHDYIEKQLEELNQYQRELESMCNLNEIANNENTSQTNGSIELKYLLNDDEDADAEYYRKRPPPSLLTRSFTPFQNQDISLHPHELSTIQEDFQEGNSMFQSFSLSKQSKDEQNCYVEDNKDEPGSKYDKSLLHSICDQQSHSNGYAAPNNSIFHEDEVLKYLNELNVAQSVTEKIDSFSSNTSISEGALLPLDILSGDTIFPLDESTVVTMNLGMIDVEIPSDSGSEYVDAEFSQVPVRNMKEDDSTPVAKFDSISDFIALTPEQGSFCGDHVVVINTKDIALPNDEWKNRMYYHHTGYKDGASWTSAWEIHRKDDTKILWKAVYKTVGGTLLRSHLMQHLHLYSDEVGLDVPEEILKNVSSQIRQLRPVPKKLDEYSKEEIEKYPKLFDWPEDYVKE
ncbi:39S ribosomal protein L13, mitochondrial [Nymphon striatum]|nr:39S ribosomal protein L13, mitochondrial [Nymphon striatum]